jgi:hypothetical protein
MDPNPDPAKRTIRRLSAPEIRKKKKNTKISGKNNKKWFSNVKIYVEQDVSHKQTDTQ